MSDELKRKAGEAAAGLVKDGQVVGLGTGSTVKFTVLRLGARMKEEGISISGVPTSRATEDLAMSVGIPLRDPDDIEIVDIAIDGADEIDPRLDLIKGHGGALLREKIVASLAADFVVVADGSKLVDRLGTKFALPVEVVPYGAKHTLRELREHCKSVSLKSLDGVNFVSDNGNFVAMMEFGLGGIDDASRLDAEVKGTLGVLESGLFLRMASRALIAGSRGVEEMRAGRRPRG